MIQKNQFAVRRYSTGISSDSLNGSPAGGIVAGISLTLPTPNVVPGFGTSYLLISYRSYHKIEGVLNLWYSSSVVAVFEGVVTLGLLIVVA